MILVNAPIRSQGLINYVHLRRKREIMTKIEGKKAENKKGATKAVAPKATPETKAVVPTKKIMTKAPEPIKVEPTPEPAVTPEVKLPERPKMPEGFCLSPEDWEANGVCYDPNSPVCKDKGSCEKDSPIAHAACKARAEFLVLLLKTPKATVRKASTGERKTSSGIPTQVKIIDDGILAKMSKDAISLAVAKAHYGGEGEVSKSAGLKRLERHLKSITTGEYTKISKEQIAYFNAKPVAAAVAPKKK